MQSVVEQSTFLKLQIAENFFMCQSSENSSEKQARAKSPVRPAAWLGPEWSPQLCAQTQGMHVEVSWGAQNFLQKCLMYLEPWKLWSQISSMSKPRHESAQVLQITGLFKKICLWEYKHRLFFQANLLQKWSLIRGSQATLSFNSAEYLQCPLTSV